MKTFPSASFCLFLALLLSCLASVPQRANATTRTVTSLADSGTGTLRDTIAASAANDSIVFSVTGTITLTSGELVIGRNLTITGPTGGVTVSGNNASRVFNIQTGTVNLSNLTLINGNPFGGVGGGIYNHNGANLTLNNCTISGNFSCGIIIDGSSGPTPFQVKSRGWGTRAPKGSAMRLPYSQEGSVAGHSQPALSAPPGTQ